jgi:IS30 family transposase
MISGKKLKKSDAYASLGEYVTKHHNIPWSPEQAKGKDKYDLYFYREI